MSDLNEEPIDSAQAHYEGNLQGNSLAMGVLDEELDHNENQIAAMEDFIQNKYGQISNLQNYLLTEFQNIQNCKTRNKRIEKILVTEVTPVLSNTKKQLQTIGNIIAPISSLAFSFIEAMAEKSKNLLHEKQQQNATLREQIKHLNKIVEQLKTQLRKSVNEINNKSQFEKEQKKPQLIMQYLPRKAEQQNNKPKNVINSEIKINKFSNVVETDNKSSRSSLLMTPNSKLKELSPVGYSRETQNICKTPTNRSKLSKYQECYNNIVQNKKLIQYRCERIVMNPIASDNYSHNSKSPSRVGQLSNKQLGENMLRYGQRKDYIKQKIEKIKIKAECRKEQYINPYSDDKIR